MAAGETTVGGGASGSVSDSAHWCLHEDCVCETEPYASAEALAAHFAEAHEPPDSPVDRPGGVAAEDAAAEDNGAGGCTGRTGQGQVGRKRFFLVLDIDQVSRPVPLYDGVETDVDGARPLGRIGRIGRLSFTSHPLTSHDG